MDSKGKETQYFRTAKQAYEKIVKGKMTVEEAWQAAALEHINSEVSQKKLCPKNTFKAL